MASQTDLFGTLPTDLPEGFRYGPDLLNANEEADLIRRIQELVPSLRRGAQERLRRLSFLVDNTFSQRSQRVVGRLLFVERLL